MMDRYILTAILYVLIGTLAPSLACASHSAESGECSIYDTQFEDQEQARFRHAPLRQWYTIPF